VAEPKSSRTAVVAAVVVVLVIVVALVLAQVLSGGDEPAASSAEASSSSGSSAGESAGESSDATPAGGVCEAPPPLPQSTKQYDEVPEAAAAQDARWTAHVLTTCGEITLELYGDKAPQTVASFLFLAEEGYWDDSPCHRLVTSVIFVLQCGDPTGTGTGDPGYGFGVENAPKDDVYPRGALAMARTPDPNTNGGQFFIVYEKFTLPDPNGYSIFGRVTHGMSIVDRVAAAGNAADGVAPAQQSSILDVKVERAD
jgi:peptidyl-prolyl cis-trans isomerase B (cyclophilin B)